MVNMPGDTSRHAVRPLSTSVVSKMATARRQRHRQQAHNVDTSNDTAFRTAERYWKSKHRKLEPDWNRALSSTSVEWDDNTDSRGRRRGIWRGESNAEPLECWQVPLQDLDVLNAWKGKSRAGARDDAIVIPRIPGEFNGASPYTAHCSEPFRCPQASCFFRQFCHRLFNELWSERRCVTRAHPIGHL